jgi:tRNA nucleotidyltransferase (CCA-adding enzyme)
MKDAENLIRNKELKGEWKSSLDKRHVMPYFFGQSQSSTGFEVKKSVGKFYQLATALSISPRVLAMKTWLDNKAESDDAIWGSYSKTRAGLVSWMAEETTAVLEEKKKSHKKEKSKRK